MKKLFISLAAIALLASCGNKQKTNNEAVEEEKSFEQEQIEANIKLQIDSLAAEFTKMGEVPFMQSLREGKIVLTEEEAQVKPEYLISPDSLDELVTLSQKYRAVAMLDADKTIAKAYGMPADGYEAAIKQLVVDIDDPAFKIFTEATDTLNHEELIKKFYEAEDEAGRINFFWETTCAYLVEELYILSQDPNNKFIECFTDENASNITYRTVLFLDALDRLKEYSPELNELSDALTPLKKLNAIDVAQLKEQLAEVNEEISEIRNNLLR
ncbi:MAG: hypothetical protein Q4F34_06580 [Prevotellaceae bacterium]|nr:hypothetical protein [Prevotellaceae bacterium]